MSALFQQSPGNWNGTDPFSNVQTTESAYLSDLYPNTTFSISDVTTQESSGSGISLSIFIEWRIAVLINKYYLYIILAIGLPGNLLAIITLLKMHPFTSSHLFMVVLAVFDSLSLILKMTFLRLSAKNMRLYDAGCKILYFLVNFSVQYANWILVAMTVERLIAVWFPLRFFKWCTKLKAVIAMVIIAIFLIALNMHFFWSWVELEDSIYSYTCYSHPDYEDFIANIWYFLNGAVYCFVPFIILFICNLMIIIGIRHCRRTQTMLTNKVERSAEKITQQNQITAMLVTVSVVFVILTAPYGIFFILKGYWNYNTSAHEYSKFSMFKQIVHLLSDLNHAANFYLYFLSERKFRQKLKSIICCRRTITPARQNTAVSNAHSVNNGRASEDGCQSTVNAFTSSPIEEIMSPTTESSMSDMGTTTRNGHV